MATVYEIITDRIIEILDKGIIPWNKPWKDKYPSFPTNLISKKPYRGINPWLLMATAYEKGYSSPYWLSFKQAKEKGGRVRTGEKGTMVIFWTFVTKENKDKEDENIKIEKIPILRYYTVFNVEQCEGIEIPVENPVIIPNKIEACEQILALYENCPPIRNGSNRAFYSPALDTITMPDKDQFIDMEHYYSTLFHEIAHSTGHESRLHRSNFDHFGSENYGKEELIAEMTAAFLCATAGIDNKTIETNAAYIASWKEAIKADTRMVIISAAQAQKAADYILGITHENHEGGN